MDVEQGDSVVQVEHSAEDATDQFNDEPDLAEDYGRDDDEFGDQDDEAANGSPDIDTVAGTLSAKLSRLLPLASAGHMDANGADATQELVDDQVAPAATPKKGFFANLQLPTLGRVASGSQPEGNALASPIKRSVGKLGKLFQRGTSVQGNESLQDAASAMQSDQRFNDAEEEQPIDSEQFTTQGFNVGLTRQLSGNSVANEIEEDEDSGRQLATPVQRRGFQIGQRRNGRPASLKIADEVDSGQLSPWSVDRTMEQQGKAAIRWTASANIIPTSPTASMAPPLPGRSIQAHLDSPQFAAANQMFPMKKMMVQGLMDFAFLSANASQLRLVLRSDVTGTSYRLFSIVLISLSISFQIIAGFTLAFLAFYDYHRQETGKERASRLILVLNYVTVLLVFIITVLNVFIAAFGIDSSNSTVPTITTTTLTPQLGTPLVNLL